MLLTVQNMYMYADVVLDSPIYAVIKDCSSPLCLVFPTLVWMTINMALVFVGSYLVTFHAVSALLATFLHLTLSATSLYMMQALLVQRRNYRGRAEGAVAPRRKTVSPKYFLNKEHKSECDKV